MSIATHRKDTTRARRYDIVSVGHVTDDILIDRGVSSRFTGGGAYFGAFAAHRLGARVLVVTKLASRDFAILEGMKRQGIEVIALPSPSTTSIENVFETADVDTRRVRLLSQAAPFLPTDLPEVEAAIYNLTGLFRGEISGELIECAARKGKVALDLQGFLRCSEGGTFAFRDWEEKRRFLPMISYLKADSLESEVVSGTPDREEAARLLHEWGAGEVVITHSSEVIAYDGGKVFRAPFNPSNLSGRSGRGDTCFMSYLAWRLTHGIEESVRLAAALTSIKMEKPGPFDGTREQAWERAALGAEPGRIGT
jgi:sugar/nucleoside kinase (ribokinase family)